MHGQSEKRVREILKRNEQRFREASSSSIAAILSERSRAKKRRPSDTVKQIMEALEEQALAFVAEAGSNVADVATDAKAYVLISEAVESFWKYLRSELRIGLEKSLGRSVPRLYSEKVDADWREARDRVFRRLDSYQMTFSGSSAGAAESLVLEKHPSNAQTRKGGRPPAKFWDQLWAAIASQLYSGDLKPKRQADIETAMADWIAKREYSASSSSVRKRARILWQAIELIDQ